MRRHAFGLLITVSGDELWTTHLPYLVSDDGETVRMHMARANPHWKAIEQQPRCRIVVQGEHAYVAPEWYDTPESVPTWNYGASRGSHGRTPAQTSAGRSGLDAVRARAS